MKRLVSVLVLVAIVVSVAAPAAEAAKKRRVVVRKGPHRTTVVVRKGFPVRRALPRVVVRAPRVRVIATPAVYLAPVVWTVHVATLPPRRHLVWEDSETLQEADGWTDFTLNVNNRGRKLFMKVRGKARLNFAEVVFANGEARVVDFKEKPLSGGLYRLLDFKDGRKVSHVRFVAKARSHAATISVYMAK